MTHTITYLDDDAVTEVRITDTPRSPSVTGYGRKIPTRYMLRVQGRWHRVYVMVYGNSGSAYVLKGGAEMFLEINTEHRVELYATAYDRSPERPAPQPVRISTLSAGDRFRFQADGVVCTLRSFGAGPAPEGEFRSGRYTWTDYQGEHTLHAGMYSLTLEPAWPYVFPTQAAQTQAEAA